MRYDAVIWDLDGTITASATGIINSVKYALQKMALPELSDEELRAFIGPPLVDSFMRYSHLNEEDALRAVAFYRERHKTVGWKEAYVYPGVFRLLRSLKRAGVYIALASSKPLPLCRNTLEYFGLLNMFDRLVGPDYSDKTSDKAALIRRALPESCHSACMVGDRRFDMEGAHGAGVAALGAGYGYGSREELLAAGADEYFETVSDLSEYLLDGLAPAPGMFITFEGSDGCGKSTQLKLLAQHLVNCGAVVTTTREPGGCPISERIRDVLLDVKSMGMTDECEALLFAASRAQHVNDVIRPALARGEIVLCDRYADSSIAYQGFGRGLGDWVESINQRVVSSCKPDLTLMFDLSPEEALNRRRQANAADRIELADVEFMNRVYSAFCAMQEKEPERIIRLDASGSVEQIQNRVRQIVTEHIF